MHLHFRQHMTAMREMYLTLKEMVDCAVHGESERVLELNTSFEALVPRVRHESGAELDPTYDNCRQSCVLPYTMKCLNRRFLNDARKRFSTIPEPE